jgi:HD-GYP domain-containing protein (c-di-GMP phosphodiesterase class II)
LSVASRANFSVHKVWLAEPLVRAATDGNSDGVLYILKEELNRAVKKFDGGSSQIDKSQMQTAAKLVVKTLEELSTHQVTLLSIIQSLFAHPTSLLTSSIEASLLSVLFAQHVGEGEQRSLEIMAYGGLLHEIGVAQLSFDPFSGLKVFDSEQRSEFMQHPILGHEFLSSLDGIPPEALLVVLQHHEWENGRGFPYMLKEIYPLAKIMAIAAEFTFRSHTHMMNSGATRRDAISMIYGDRGKFDLKLLDQFCQMMMGEKPA